MLSFFLSLSLSLPPSFFLVWQDPVSVSFLDFSPIFIFPSPYVMSTEQRRKIHLASFWTKLLFRDGIILLGCYNITQLLSYSCLSLLDQSSLKTAIWVTVTAELTAIYANMLYFYIILARITPRVPRTPYYSEYIELKSSSLWGWWGSEQVAQRSV